MSASRQILEKAKDASAGLYDELTPFARWVGELKSQSVLKCDIIAGITVALVLIPQSMAYAQLADLPPYYGLYASFLPVAVAAVFGSSRQLATGPVAIVSLLTASAVGPLVATAGGEAFIAYAVLIALMVGVIQLAMGLMRLGVLVDFISHPVVIGFTNAAAIIIATSQLGPILGVSVERAPYHYETIWNIMLATADQAHWQSLGIAALSLAIMLAARRFAPKWPDVLLAVAVATLLSWWLGFKENGGMVVGEIPQGLPDFSAPTANFEMIRELSGAAIAIALIGFTEAISVAKVMAASTRQRLDANQELIGQGLSNIAASFSQGYAVSGSFSRSAVNFSAQAVTGFSSVVTAVVVGFTLLFLTPLFYHLPQPALAAVIILAVAGLIKVKPFLHIWKVQRHDAVVSLLTFLLTLVFAPHLENGILIGAALSLGLYVYRTMRPSVVLLARHEGGGFRDATKGILKTCPKIAILRFGGPLFFANTGYFEHKILDRVASQPELRFIIIDAVSMNEIDATGEAMLHQLARRLVELHIEFLFVRVPAPVMETLERSGFASAEWADHFFMDRKNALAFAWRKLAERKDTECSVSACDTRDLSSCVLHSSPRTANPFLNTVAGRFKGPTHTKE